MGHTYFKPGWRCCHPLLHSERCARALQFVCDNLRNEHTFIERREGVNRFDQDQITERDSIRNNNHCACIRSSVARSCRKSSSVYNGTPCACKNSCTAKRSSSPRS